MPSAVKAVISVAPAAQVFFEDSFSGDALPVDIKGHLTNGSTPRPTLTVTSSLAFTAHNSEMLDQVYAVVIAWAAGLSPAVTLTKKDIFLTGIITPDA